MASATDIHDGFYNCMRIWEVLDTNKALDGHDLGLVYDFCGTIYHSEQTEMEGRSYSKPMLWIGIYIAVASLFCILLMAADLFHGFRNKKPWFPSNNFTLNAASITVITIAMKLPVDLSSQMPGFIDQHVKVGSIAFMCTMMANLMPSLATMDNRELFTNVAGLIILVVTMITNILIQMRTGIVQNYYIIEYIDMNINMYINLGAMLSLLVLVISSSLTIPTSKRILELMYQTVHKTTSNDLHHTRMSTVEELTQHVRKYWVMAATCSPQFVMITTPLYSAAGIIGVATAILHYFIVVSNFRNVLVNFECRSDYKWSILVIYITQTVGIGVGTIALVFRCFAALNFKLSIKWITKHTKVWQVEKFWTQMLMEWKKIHLAFPLGVKISTALVDNLYNLILNTSIICQTVIVVTSKIIRLIPLGIVIIGVVCIYCWKSLKTNFFANMCVPSNGETITVVERNDTNEDIGNYALHLQDEVEFGIRTLKSMSNAVNRSIQKAEKQLPINLLKLIEQSIGFEGVVNFDSDDIQPLDCVKFPNSWSLPVLTLTCIAITLPNISQENVDRLFKSVCEGLSYTLLIEETLNNVAEYPKIHKATTALWREVEVKKRWLGNKLQRNAHKDKNPKEILEWFADKAKEIVVEMSKHNNEEQLDDSHDHKLIVVDSMYRITQTIMVNYPNDIEHNREVQLFGLLSGMIVDITFACFTNLPSVIGMKCHKDAIEKREASVRSAAKLLGNTKKIIEKVQLCDQVPALDPYQMAFIDEWRVHLKQSIP